MAGATRAGQLRAFWPEVPDRSLDCSARAGRIAHSFWLTGHGFRPRLSAAAGKPGHVYVESDGRRSTAEEGKTGHYPEIGELATRARPLMRVTPTIGTDARS